MMNNEDKLTIKVALNILAPVSTVFDAIVRADKMSNYFISKSSGDMEEGTVLTWQFPEFDMEFPVIINKVRTNELVEFSWVQPDGHETTVMIDFLSKKPGETFLTIHEGTKPNNEDGLKWLMSNTEGWANFLACLKAWVEYGINLRKGAFDISQMPVADEVK